MEIDKKSIKGLIIVDVRNNIDYKTSHIPGSTNINYDDLMFEPDKYLDKNKKYCFYCERGIKSLKLSKYLNSIGYITYSIKGGYK